MKRSSTVPSTSTHIDPSDYVAKVERFDKTVAKPSTETLHSGANYNSFVSDRGEFLGSLSISSRQDSCRAINASLSARTPKR